MYINRSFIHISHLSIYLSFYLLLSKLYKTIWLTFNETGDVCSKKKSLSDQTQSRQVVACWKMQYFFIVKDANLCSCLLRFVTWLLDFDRVQNGLLTQGNNCLTQGNNCLTPGQQLSDPGQQLPADPGQQLPANLGQQCLTQGNNCLTLGNNCLTQGNNCLLT